MSQLSSNLNSRRLALNLTYEQVWDQLQAYPWSEGIKPPSLAVVGHWFNGERKPREMEHLQGLCKVLGVTIDQAASGAPAEALTATEQAVLETMRRLTPESAEFLLATALHMAGKDG